MHSQGQAYVSSISTTGAYKDMTYSASSKPSSFYTLLEQKPKVIRGNSFTLSLVANNLGDASAVRQDLRYNQAHIYLDAYGSGEFTKIATIGEFAPKENIGANYSTVLDINQEISIPDDASSGSARVRVIYQNAWYSLSGPNAKDVSEGVAYDISIDVLERDPNPSYTTPSGSLHADHNAYVKQLWTTDANSNIFFEWDECPSNVYTCVESGLEAVRGEAFTLRLVGNNLGNTSVVRQDLRYNQAFIYLDAYGTGEFTQIASYGQFAPSENIGANYSTVLDITQAITIPADATNEVARIRVIYQNAWISLSGPNASNIYEGQAIDIPITVVDGLSGIDDLMADPAAKRLGTYDLLGRRITGRPAPGIYIIDGKKVLVK